MQHVYHSSRRHDQPSAAEILCLFRMGRCQTFLKPMIHLTVEPSRYYSTYSVLSSIVCMISIELNDMLALDLNLLQAKFTLQWVTAAL